MLQDGTLTYVSLFSSAGVGCFSFKELEYKCIATNELLEKRLNIQKINNKCELETGYIQGDIQATDVKEQLNNEINKWNKKGNDKIDLIVATPPCQGMSVANHKKNDNEIKRNSLVVESILSIKKYEPRFFLFENVAAFWKTGCTSPNGEVKKIGTVINEELGDNYLIAYRKINLKNYGSHSSRTRTVVIGVHKNLQDFVSPIELFPSFKKEKSLKDIIGKYKKLEWGEIDKSDFYHNFRIYPERMRTWINDLPQGMSAFDNNELEKKPHQIKDGKIILNKRKNGGKYTRQKWDKVGPCIHTRNDQLASQDTIHPDQDRVFSIRELMELMTIPNNFKWLDIENDELNNLPIEDKKALLKREEMNIRQSIGEAVPTNVFRQIGKNIIKVLQKKNLTHKEIKQIIEEHNLFDFSKLEQYIKKEKDILSFASLSSIVEYANSKRVNNSAYFTNKFLINEIFRTLPNFQNKKEITIIEPSVGAGNFIPLLLKKYDYVDKVNLVLYDIDNKVLEVLKLLLTTLEIPDNFTITFSNQDYLESTHDRVDLVIGNPPFSKVKGKKKLFYLASNENKSATNLAEFFIEKAIKTSDFVSLIMPKNLLNTNEYSVTRDILSSMAVLKINDFGEKGFKGVLVETVSLLIDTTKKPKKTKVYSMTKNLVLKQDQKYIMDNNLPYWVIYRNKFFDDVFAKLEFNVFDSFRDRQITNSNSTVDYRSDFIRVLKSRNISDRGDHIIDIPGYDAYINPQILSTLSISRFLENDSVYLTPNMTYKPRVMKKEKGYVVNGSVAILLPKMNSRLSDKQLKYLSSDEFRKFYMIARNYQTRSLNIDKTSVFWFGLLKED